MTGSGIEVIYAPRLEIWFNDGYYDIYYFDLF